MSTYSSELKFCQFVAANFVRDTMTIAEIQNPDRDALPITAQRTLALHLQIGTGLARAYPGKARAILVHEDASLVLNRASDRFGAHRRADILLFQREAEVLEDIEAEWDAYFQKAVTEGHSVGWLFGKAYSHIVYVMAQGEVVSANLLFGAAVGAMRDGLAFGLFSPDDVFLKAFYRELRDVVSPLENDAEFVSTLLKSYESHYGVITELAS